MDRNDTRDAADEPATSRFAVVPEEAIRSLTGDTTAVAVFAVLALHADRDGHARPHQATLAALLGIDVGTTRRALTRLVTLRMIEKFTVYDARGRRSGNGYRILIGGELTARQRALQPRVSARSRDARERLLRKEQLEMNKEKASQPEPHLATVTEMPSDRIIDVPSIVDEVFAEWVRANAKTAMTKLTDARRKMIEKRYSKDGYPLDDILDAIRGNAASTWHAENGHTDLKDAIGDETKLEKWRDVWRRPKRARMANQSAGGYDKFAEIDRRAAERAARGVG